MSCCIFVSRSGGKRRGKKLARWRCGGEEEIQVASPTSSCLLVYNKKCFGSKVCVCVCVLRRCVLVLHRASLFFSLCPFPHPSCLLLTTCLDQFRGALPPQAEAMLVQRQIAQHAVVWAQMHTQIHTQM